MNQHKNLIEQIYQRVEHVYGSSGSYFTLVLKGPQLHLSNLEVAKSNQFMKMAEEDTLTNVLCAPYQVVSDILPYTLSSRLQYVLSNWISSHQALTVQNGIRIYQDEGMFYETMRECIQRAVEIEKGIHKTFNASELKEWKKEYASLLGICKNLYESIQTKNKVSNHFGEEELLKAKNLLKNYKYVMPNEGYVYQVNCLPENWVDYLSNSFGTEDKLPSLYDILKKLFTLSEEIERQVKKLLFYVSQEDQTWHSLRSARKSLIEKSVLLSQAYLDSHDQQLIFLIGSIFSKQHMLNAQTFNTLQNFFHTEASGKKLREVMMRLIGEQRAYWKALELLTKKNDKDNITNELVMKIRTTLQEWKLWKNNLHQANNEAFIKKHTKQLLLPRKKSPNYLTFIGHSTFSQFFEPIQLTQDKTFPKGLSVFFGQSMPYDIDEEEAKKIKISLGFQFTQVDIKRKWLMEEIFALSFAYQRICDEEVAQDVKHVREIKKTLLLPSYPKGMLVAKDVTIHLNFHEVRKELMEIVKQNAQYGKGFLCFQEDVSQITPYMECSEEDIILRYPKAYILGYFMRITPKDLSKKIGGI